VAELRRHGQYREEAVGLRPVKQQSRPSSAGSNSVTVVEGNTRMTPMDWKAVRDRGR
jgi:hypothetical protein